MKTPRTSSFIILYSLASFFFSLFLFSCATLTPSRYIEKAESSNQNTKKIIQLKKELCEKQSSIQDCNDYAELIWDKKNPTVSLQVLKEGCEKNFVQSCHLLARYQFRAGIFDESQNTLSTLCNESTLGVAPPEVLTQDCAASGTLSALEDKKLQAITFFKKACLWGDLESCVLWGRGLRQQNRPSPALPSLLKACDQDYAPACAELGLSQLLEKQTQGALKNLEKGCAEQAEPACQAATLIRLQKSDAQFEKNQKELCKKGELSACHSDAIFQLYRKGGRVLALHYLKQNCDAGYLQSCWDQLIEKVGMKPLSSESDEIEALCKKGLPQACYHQAFFEKENNHPQEAYSLWKKSCDQGVAWACWEVSQDPQMSEIEREKKLTLACDQGIKLSCKTLGTELYYSGNKEKGEHFLSLACPTKTLGNCLEISTQSHRASKTDLASLKERCKGKEAEACSYLGFQAKKEGKIKEATNYYRQACDGHSTLGCEGLLEILSK